MRYDRKLAGRNLRQSRLDIGLTQKETAKRAGLSLSHYQKLERGEAGLSVSTLMRLCCTLLVAPSSLFSDDPSAHGPCIPIIAQAILNLPPDKRKSVIDLIRIFLQGN